MTKNSARKKTARQRAVRSGERYTRALRAIREPASTTPPDQAAGQTDEDAGHFDLAGIHAVQQLLQARGWTVPAEARGELDTDGLAVGTELYFDYPAAFSRSSIAGDRFEEYLGHLDDDLAEDRPRGPECSFSWNDASGLVVVIETAGNWQGCRHHRVVAHTVAMDEELASRLLLLLAEVESAARVIDPARLLACTLEGPCGGYARQRAAHRQRNLVWNSSMLEAGRQFSPEQMADLLAWEAEHLGRTLGSDGEPLGTSDWPGWIPLIGSPPWKQPEANEPRPGMPTRSPDNDGVPVDLLRPAFERGISATAVGLWSMLVSYYWSCEADRTVAQLHEHRPQDAAETDAALAELVAVGMVTVSAGDSVAINPDHLGEINPLPPSRATSQRSTP